jgi:ABC-type nitrate/sulfonate/bicarbonate transport system permease component
MTTDEALRLDVGRTPRYRSQGHRPPWYKRAWVLRVVSVAAVIALWQLIGVHIAWATSYPTAIWHAAVGTDMLAQSVLPAFGYTLESLAIGFGICILVGVPLGLAVFRIKLLQLIFEPYILALYSTPWPAFFPVLLIVFGISLKLRVGVVILSGLFPIVVNTYLGAREVDPGLVDVGRSFAARPVQILRKITVPGSLPYIYSGLRIGLARAMIGAVVIELEASAVGVGSLLNQYAQGLELAQFFVPLVLLGFLALGFTYILNKAERWSTAPWSRHGYLIRQSGSSKVRQGWRRASLHESSAAVTPDTEGEKGDILGKVRSSYLRAVSRPRVKSEGRLRVERFLRTRAGAWTVSLVTLGVLLASWQFYSHRVSRAVLPSFTSVAQALYRQMFVTHAIWGPMGSSLLALLLAFVASVIIGIPIGIAMGRSRAVESVIDPYVSFLYALPHVTFIPLMVVWLGFGLPFIIAYGFVSAVFAVIINTMSGVKYIDAELVNTGLSFCASKRMILRQIVIPAATPSMVAGGRQAFSQAWGAIIIGEILSTQSGLGGQITYYSTFFQTANMIVPILFIMGISVLILQSAAWLQPRLTPWANSSQTS